MTEINNESNKEDQAADRARIAVYVRESRDDYGENIETIETQRDMLIDHVAGKGLGIVYAVYSDNNVSGSAFNRDGLLHLKRDVENGLVDIVLVKDLSRLGRNNARTLELLDYFEEYGIRVITYDGKFDSLRDNETVGIETWYNERYIKDISRKTRASLKFKIKNGEYIGSAPYGYRKSLEKKNCLVIDEPQADIVKLIYKRYMEGLGYAAIAKYLDSVGCNPPGYMSRSWNPVTVKRILENRVYTGDTVQGVSEKVSFKSKKIRRLPQSDWVITQNTHEAIIDRDMYETVNQIRMGRRHGDVRTNIKHTYSGIIFCGSCGMPMYARVRKDRPIGYICSSYAKKGSDKCRSHFIKEMDINEAVKNEIMKLFSDEELLCEVEQYLKEYYSPIHTPDSHLSEYWSKLNRKIKHQETLYTDKLEGKISYELFQRINKNIEKEICVLQSCIEQYRNMDSFKYSEREIINFAKSHIQKEYMTSSIVNCIVEKIIIYTKGDLIALAGSNVENNIKTDLRNVNNIIEVYYKHVYV